MKFKKNMKKGFTLVELIVVIAIVAILAAVSVVSYLAFINSANESADIQLVKQLNVALQADETLNGPRDTMHEMLGAMEDNGFVVENLTKTKSGYDIVWDQEHNRFGLLNGNNLVYGESTYNSAKAWNIWKFADTEDEAKNKSYSVYLTEEFANTNVNVTELEIKAGLDVGNYDKLTSISYKNTSEDGQKVVIRTNGGELVVNDESTGTIKHYGKAGSVNIIKCHTASYHEFGTVPFIQISQGRVELESTADVNGIHVANVQTVAEDGTITKTANKFSNDVVLTLNGNDVKLTRDTIGTEIANPVLVCEVQANANSDEYIWLVGDGTIESAKVYVTGTNATPDTSVASTTTTANASAAAIAIANNSVGGAAQESGVSAENAQAASALKGAGTENDPFLIYDYETFQKVTSFYGKGYNYFEVAIEKTNNGHIDCTGWNRVYLQGSIEGNGVILDNVDDCLFEAVQGDTLTGMNGLNGSKGGGNPAEFKNTQCVVSNMDVNCNIFSTANKAGLIRSAGQNILIDNVDIHGKIQAYSGAAYIGYGVGQFNVYNKGVTSTWYFKNCESDALIQATTENVAAFIVNEYSGTAGNITLDNSGFTGYLNQKNSYTEFKYVGIASTSSISYINDETYASKHNENKYIDSTKCVSFTTETPVAQSKGFGEIVTVDKVSGATMALVNLTFRVDDGVVNIPLEEAAVEKKIDNVNKWCSTNILNAKVVWGENLSSHYDGDTYYYQYDGTKVDAGGMSYICITQYNANGLIIARSQLNLTNIQKISN